MRSNATIHNGGAPEKHGQYTSPTCYGRFKITLERTYRVSALSIASTSSVRQSVEPLWISRTVHSS